MNLTDMLASPDGSVGGALIGASRPFQEALRLIHKLAACTAPALIQGETGTGKELAARAIHYCGPRKKYPFIPVNCGAIPDNLVENEFFGHIRGAYTDARENQIGIVASADGGTLFLDEIECLSPKCQTVLLRFLQDQVYRPLGAREPVVGNVRIIAASNCDLAKLVRSGAFRQDLLYRLAVLEITMPPLRDRTGDIALLANEFMRRFAIQYNEPERLLDAEQIALLMRHTWPGNIRELENVIHRQLLLNDNSEITAHVSESGGQQASLQVRQSAPLSEQVVAYVEAKSRAVEQFDRAYLERVLAATLGNVTKAARLAGKDRRAFGRLIKRYSISTASFHS